MGRVIVRAMMLPRMPKNLLFNFVSFCAPKWAHSCWVRARRSHHLDSLVRMTTRSRQGKGRNPLLASIGGLTEVKSSKFTVKRNAPKVLFESLGAELETESGGDAETDDCGCDKQHVDGAREHSADLPEQGEKERVHRDRGYDTDRYRLFFAGELGDCPDGGAEDESPERTADEGCDDVGRSQNDNVVNVDSDRDEPSGNRATKQASKFVLH